MEPLVCITKTNAKSMSLRIIYSVHILADPGKEGKSSIIDEDGNEIQPFIETIEPVLESWKVTVLVRFYDNSCKVVESTMLLFTDKTEYNTLLLKPTTQSQINDLYNKVRDKYNFIYKTNIRYLAPPLSKVDDNFIYELLTPTNINVCQLCKDAKKTLYYLENL